MSEPTSGHITVLFGAGALFFALSTWVYLSNTLPSETRRPEAASSTGGVAKTNLRHKRDGEEIDDGRTPRGLLGAKSVRSRILRRKKVLTQGVDDPELLESASRGSHFFKKSYGAKEGLGPTFNENSCLSCHDKPVALGRGGKKEKTIILGSGVRESLGDAKYAGIMSRHTQRVPGAPPQVIPEVMKTLGARRPPSLRGLGWMESIPAEQVIAGNFCESPVTPGDKICGWVTLKKDRASGSHRFGIKLPTSSLDEFVASAFFLEMGITTTYPGFHEDDDDIPDPEVSDEVVVDIANYIALSQPPEAGPEDHEGLALFNKAGCADCHWGDYTIEGVKAPQMYSDLLAHDLGPGLAESDYDERTPPGHFRTTPLWGFSDHEGPYLTAGGADTPREAILLHGGEAEASRDQFKALPETEQKRLIQFLKSL